MWDGVTYVEPSRRPIIHEGSVPARLIVTNVGPGVIDLLVWIKATFGNSGAPTRADIQMRMPPGNTRSVSGDMIGVALSDNQDAGHSPHRFAAIAWRVL